MLSIQESFHKFLLGYLTYMVRPALAPVRANQKKSEARFCFCTKRQKAELVFRVCFAAGPSRGSAPPEQRGWPHRAPSLGTGPRVSTSRCQSFKWGLRAPVPYRDVVIRALASEMCPQV